MRYDLREKINRCFYRIVVSVTQMIEGKLIKLQCLHITVKE